jgi:hypothetical protein
MPKNKKFKKHSKDKKRKKHNPLTYSPPIKPNPTVYNTATSLLPEIIIDCEAEISDESISTIKKRLDFTDHNDFRKLKCIRIVNPDRIKMPSKKTTTGCYFEAQGSSMAEIWISSELLKPQQRLEHFFNRITKKDTLFEALFHELGHHKSKLVHSIDKFEGEAYAEKYMIAYRKYWRKVYGPSKLITIPFRLVIYFFRYISISFLFFIKNRSPESNLFYLYLTQKISREEFIKKHSQLFEYNEDSEQPKKKWIHPLRRKKYRKRFSLPER